MKLREVICGSCLRGRHEEMAYMNCGCRCHLRQNMKGTENSPKGAPRIEFERVLQAEGMVGFAERENRFKGKLERNRQRWGGLRGDSTGNPTETKNLGMMKEILAERSRVEEGLTLPKGWVSRRQTVDITVMEGKEGLWKKTLVRLQMGVMRVLRMKVVKTTQRRVRRISFLE